MPLCHFARVAAAWATLVFVPLSHAAPAHQHGVAALDIVVDATTLTVRFASPLDSLLGFERAPRTDAERNQVKAMADRLKAAEAMFKIDPAAGCRVANVELVSAVLKLGTPSRGEEADGHADIVARYEFKCADATKAAYIETGLFSFSRLQRLQGQVVTPRGQFKRELKRPAARVLLTR